MFQADGPEKNLGKAKLADIASAKFRRGEVKADNWGEWAAESEEEDEQPARKDAEKKKPSRMQVEVEEEVVEPWRAQKNKAAKARADSESEEEPVAKWKSKKAEDTDDQELLRKAQEEKRKLKLQIEQEEREAEELERKLKARQRNRAEEEEEEEDKEEEDGDDRAQVKQKRKVDKFKRAEEIKEIKRRFYEKLLSPFTEFAELQELYMRPIPKEVGTVECTISRNKSGFNFLFPKYILKLSEGDKFLLSGKKRSGNKTSNYLITLDSQNLKKKAKGFLGKVRANFMGTMFEVYDDGDNPKGNKKKSDTGIIWWEMASVLYESNVLGSKGPRKMTVMIPTINAEDDQAEWRPEREQDTMISRYKANNHDNMLKFHNKEPKWNDTVQAYVLNFNGWVD
jgi:tubby-related protein 1